MKIKSQNLFIVNNLPVNIDINIESGINILIGENGVGKSTFFNFIKNNHESLLKQKSAAFMDQFPFTPINEVRMIDVIDFLDRGIGYFSKSTALELISVFDLSYLLKRSISLYSGGENQALKFILLLSQNVDYYFLDEPLQYIDKSRLELIKTYLSQIGADKKVVIIEHRDELLLDLNPRKIQMVVKDKEVIINGI